MGSRRGQGVDVLIPILLDTDLGSDVDDELALALLWGSPEVDLLGVCTTYGDTALRARIALRMAELVGRSVTVAAGEVLPASGKDVWWAGIEGAAYDELPELAGPASGVQLLVAAGAGAHLLAIAPLTSVAAALHAGMQVEGITIMGGDWSDPSVAEHNLAAEMRAWTARWDEDFEVPHDPLTALALLEPELFTFTEPCAVSVSDGSDGPEGAVRRLDETGTVRIATAVDVPAARRSMADRIAAGLGEHRTHVAR